MRDRLRGTALNERNSRIYSVGKLYHIPFLFAKGSSSAKMQSSTMYAADFLHLAVRRGLRSVASGYIKKKLQWPLVALNGITSEIERFCFHRCGLSCPDRKGDPFANLLMGGNAVKTALAGLLAFDRGNYSAETRVLDYLCLWRTEGTITSFERSEVTLVKNPKVALIIATRERK